MQPIKNITEAFEELDKIYEARYDKEPGHEYGYPGDFQLSIDDLDDNLDIKPEVKAAMEKRVELEKNFDTLHKHARSADTYKAKNALADKAKKKYATLLKDKNASPEELDAAAQNYLDLLQIAAELESQSKVNHAKFDTAHDNLRHDIKNNKYIDTNVVWPEKELSDHDKWEARWEAEQQAEIDKAAGQEWIDFKDTKNPRIMTKELKPEQKAWRERHKVKTGKDYPVNPEYYWNYNDIPIDELGKKNSVKNKDSYNDEADALFALWKDRQLSSEELRVKLAELDDKYDREY